VLGGIFFLGLWSFLITCKTLGEVNGFSVFKGFLTIIIATLILLIPIVAIIFAITLFAPGMIPNSLDKAPLMNKARQVVSKPDPIPIPKALLEPIKNAVAPPTAATIDIPVEYSKNVESDTVKLRNGKVRDGTILYEDDHTVYIETSAEIFNIPKDEIESIVRKDRSRR
jgi:hypothetical protein